MPDRWTHICAVFSGHDGTAAFYPCTLHDINAVSIKSGCGIVRGYVVLDVKLSIKNHSYQARACRWNRRAWFDRYSEKRKVKSGEYVA
jgi:hypothetical protein